MIARNFDLSGTAAAGPLAAMLAALLFAAPVASAQTAPKAPSGEPITIGFSMALTGSLAVNGKSGLLATQIWAEDTNAKGGLLGPPGQARLL